MNQMCLIRRFIEHDEFALIGKRYGRDVLNCDASSVCYIYNLYNRFFFDFMQCIVKSPRSCRGKRLLGGYGDTNFVKSSKAVNRSGLWEKRFPFCECRDDAAIFHLWINNKAIGNNVVLVNPQFVQNVFVTSIATYFANVINYTRIR